MVQSLMRIAFISQHADMIGGGEYSLLDLMTNLPQTYTSELFIPQPGSFEDKAKLQNIPVKHMPMPKVGFGSLFIIRCWLKCLRKFSPHIIHANNSRAAFYAGIAGKWLNIPVIFHCRIADSDGLMDRILSRLVDVVVCNSKSVAMRFETWDKPVHVIYNGLNIEPIAKKDSPKPISEKYLLFVGRITEEKQVEHVLQVFAELAEKDKALHLVIVGGQGPNDDGYAMGLKEWSEKQTWGNRVLWQGQVDDVRPWYAHAQMLILTSKHEGFGRVLVEAMAQACPVVAYAVGGVSEVFEDGKQGYLIPADDKKAMVNACESLLQDEAKRQSMGMSGKERAMMFNVAEHIRKVQGVYKEVLHGK